MPQSAQAFIDTYLKRNAPREYTKKQFLKLTNDLASVYDVYQYFLKNDKQLDFSVSFLTEEQLDTLIVEALDLLKKGHNKGAVQVILEASWQFPELLHKYLDVLTTLKSYFDFDYYSFFWRYAPPSKIALLQKKLQAPETSVSDKLELFECLLQTRDLAAVQFAYQFAIDTNLIPEAYGVLGTDRIIAYLEAIGFTVKNKTIVRYCYQPTYHLQFSRNYFKFPGPNRASDPPTLSDFSHPAWNLSPEKGPYRFGGVLQDDEKKPFAHIITLDPIPEGLPISGFKKLTLGVHIAAMENIGIVYYKHDTSGNPHSIESRISECQDEEMWLLPIKETQISLARTPQRWTLQDWNSTENLFKIGGEPTWIQCADTLSCSECKTKMDFLMQLDTGLPDIKNGEVWFGSGGICYIFWCDACNVSGYMRQYT